MSNKQYVIKFENGKRIATIATDNDIDLRNKKAQADNWAKDSVKRKVMVSEDNRNYIKLVAGKIKAMTQAEIDKVLEAQKVKTPKENLLELLNDTDIKNKIKAIK